MKYRVTVTAPSSAAVLATWVFAASKPKQFLAELVEAGAPAKTLDYVRRNGVPRRTNWETPVRKVVVTKEA